MAKLKDFDIVAHVIKMDEHLPLMSQMTKSEATFLLAVYINKYGLEVGGLVEIVYKCGHSRAISYDHYLWEEIQQAEADFYNRKGKRK